MHGEFQVVPRMSVLNDVRALRNRLQRTQQSKLERNAQRREREHE